MQSEVENIKSEIDRIAQSTNFNEIKLLDGSLGKEKVTKAKSAMTTVIDDECFLEIHSVIDIIHLTEDPLYGDGYALYAKNKKGDIVKIAEFLTSKRLINGEEKPVRYAASTVDISGNGVTLSSLSQFGDNNFLVYNSVHFSIVDNPPDVGGQSIKIEYGGIYQLPGSVTITFFHSVKTTNSVDSDKLNVFGGGDAKAEFVLNQNDAIGNFSDEEVDLLPNPPTTGPTFYVGVRFPDVDKEVEEIEKSNGFTLQIGADSNAEHQVAVNIGAMDSSAIGVADFDVSTVRGAQTSMGNAEAAIAVVSWQRAALGALQNRLEYTVNSLINTNENITAAQSQIRDTDMALEMMNYQKYNTLVQTAQMMLRQAEQSPQAVLDLLEK
jgi:flagellin